jgi:hypothetical protein
VASVAVDACHELVEIGDAVAVLERQIDHGVSRERLRRHERVAVHLEEEHTDHEADTLVPVGEGMVANDGLRVERGQLDEVGFVSVGEVLWRSSQGR